MTTIAVIRCEQTRKFYIAADKQTSYGWNNYVVRPNHCKFREVYNGVLGFSGTNQKIEVLLHNACKLLKFKSSLNFYTTAQQLYEKYKLDSEKKKDGLKDNDIGGIAIRGDRLYMIYSNLEIIEWPKPYACSGSGGEYASGAIEALLGREQPEQILKTAIEISSRNDIYTCNEYDLLARSFDA